VEGLKARRGDLSGPVLAILVTLVLLAIGAAIIAYFVLLGGTPQQGVIAVVGQPTIVKSGADGFEAKIVVKNVGSATIPSSTATLNIPGIAPPPSASMGDLAPGATTTLTFTSTSGWSTAIADKEFVSAALTVPNAGTMEVVFRVIKPS
jgi:hypothetical protein